MKSAAPILCILAALGCAIAAWSASLSGAPENDKRSAKDDMNQSARGASAEKIIVVAAPERADPVSFAAALAKARAGAAGGPFRVLDISESSAGSVAAKLQFIGRDADVVVGSLPGFGRETIPVAEFAAPKYELSEIHYIEYAEGGRGFRIRCFGENLHPANLMISTDGGKWVHPRTEPAGSGAVDLVLDPLQAGRHKLQITAGIGEPAIRAGIESGDAPLALAANPGGFAAKALAAQGFRVAPFVTEIPEAASLILINSADFDIKAAERAVRKECGFLWIGGAGMLRAQAAPALESALVARARPLPAAPEDPPPADPSPGDAPTVEDHTPQGPPPDETPPATPIEPTKAAGTPELTKTTYRAPVVAMALVIDRSGSMAGEKIKLAKQSAIATANILAADDYISIISFNDQSNIDYRADIVGSPDKIKSVVSRIAPPDGGTLFYPALVDAANQLKSVAAAIRHIVLITDGATHDRFTADYRRLVEEVMAPSGITLSTVFTVGEGDADPEFCGLLAKWGRGRTYPASIQQIPALVAVEVRRVAGLPDDGSRRAAPGPPPNANPNNHPPAKPNDPKTDAPKPALPKKDPNKTNKPAAKPKDRPVPKKIVATAVAVPGNRITDGLDLAGLPAVGAFCELEPEAGAAVLLKSNETGGALFVFGRCAAGTAAQMAIDDAPDGLGHWADDPRLRVLLSRAATLLAQRPASAARAESFEAVARDGVLLKKGDDAFGLLNLTNDPTNPEAERLQFEGELRRLEGGECRSSLRAVGRAREMKNAERELELLKKSAPTRRDPESVGPAAGEIVQDHSWRNGLWCAAMLLAVAAAILGRRSG
ncbi:MAG: VWA domain-containing protein [Planctomycetes bacterium]|nr:VWA domain-containing protein [Planctomycetota bacterium]